MSDSTRKSNSIISKKEILDFLISRTAIFVYSSLLSVVMLSLFQQYYTPNKQLVYTITSPKVLVNNNRYTSCFLCKDSIESYYVDFVLFNIGEQHVDFSDVLLDGKLILRTNDDISNLKVREIVKSRESLTVVPVVNHKGKSIEINFNGNEALEYEEGFFIRFKYFGTNKYNWTLESRIKGFKGKVKKIEPTFFAPVGNTFILQSHIFIIALWSLALIILAFYEYKSNEKIVKDSFYRGLLAFSLVGGLILVMYLLITDLRFSKKRPEWFKDEENIVIYKYFYDNCCDELKPELIVSGVSICNE